MVPLLARIVGLLFLAAALIALVVDGARSIAASALTTSSLGQTWFSLSRGSLDQMRAMVAGDVEPYVGHWVWDPVVQSLLSLPAWLVLGVLGLVLIWLGRPRRRRSFRPEHA